MQLNRSRSSRLFGRFILERGGGGGEGDEGCTCVCMYVGKLLFFELTLFYSYY